VRFVISGEWSRNRLLRIILLCFLVYTFILWLTNAGMYFSKMGLTPTSVVDYYCGNEDRYLEPRSLRGLLEVLHFHSFAMGMLLLTLTHMMLFVPVSLRTKGVGIATAFGAGLVGEASGWAVRFLHPLFAYVKIGSFLVLEGVILWLMILVTQALITEAPSDYENGASPHV
jgi:hypothetical protein